MGYSNKKLVAKLKSVLGVMSWKMLRLGNTKITSHTWSSCPPSTLIWPSKPNLNFSSMNEQSVHSCKTHYSEWMLVDACAPCRIIDIMSVRPTHICTSNRKGNLSKLGIRCMKLYLWNISAANIFHWHVTWIF